VRSQQKRHCPRSQGLSLLELLLTLTIIAVIVAFAYPSIGYFRRRAQEAACLGNLRGLHAAFVAYLNENDQVWPQNPQSGKENPDENAENRFWIETLQPYGPNRQTWLCQADRQGTAKDNDPNNFSLSYEPAWFDETRGQAYKYDNIPWLIEPGASHVKGEILMVLPNGSIKKDAALGSAAP
jgi:prepilin-type N-terminal cleavage/methylation domain-containing protein